MGDIFNININENEKKVKNRTPVGDFTLENVLNETIHLWFNKKRTKNIRKVSRNMKSIMQYVFSKKKSALYSMANTISSL